jgi:hypothetical protein
MPKWHCHDRRLSQPESDVSTFVLPSKTTGVLGSEIVPWAYWRHALGDDDRLVSSASSCSS